MQKTTTLMSLKLFLGKVLPFLILLALSAGMVNAQAQVYNNGNLSTGATSSNGTAAPAGYTWSEVQAGNTTGGAGANITANISMFDDFTVPASVGWDLSKITFYAYSTLFTGATSPFNDVRVRIFNTDPHVAIPPTPVYGDLTTNRFAASSDAMMFRIFNATPGTDRKIWKVEANISKVLGPGHYWIEWQLGNGGLSNFSPPSTVVGTTTQAGNNAKQRDNVAGTWIDPLVDGANPQDMPFRLDFSIVAQPPCTPATASVISAPNVPLNQTFDGTTVPTGWVQQNNSVPVGATNWTMAATIAAADLPFTPHTGAGYISANFNNTAGAGAISNWLLSPVITLKNGDQFSFWTRTTDGDFGIFDDRLQVRMSTNGTSTNVGTGATGTGDFGTMLLDINPSYSDSYPRTWTKFTVTVSGVPTAGVSGRMAFRYFVEDGGPSGSRSDFMGIDDVLYTAADPVTICSGSSTNLVVNITDGVGPYTIVYNPGNVTVNNYNSGANIPVSPTTSTTYTLVSVKGADGCVGTGNSGSATVNVTTGSTAAVLSQMPLPPTTTTVVNQNFDVAIPLPAGWAQQNLSVSPGQAYIQGNATNFPSHSGAANSYISALWSSTSSTATNATISNWLFMPAMTNMKAGDVLTFWTRSQNTIPDRLQVWMNKTDGTANAGTTPTSTGNFTESLLDINPTYATTGYPNAWTQFTVTIPVAAANGRIAFRYFVENGGLNGANSNVIGIDDVVYTTTTPGAPPTTCTGSSANLQVNITGGLSPYTVVITPTSPAGAPITVTGYTSGSPILVTPAVTTTYALTSVTSAAGCVGTGNSGTPTITVSATTTNPIAIKDDPTGPLCAGSPKLLTAVTGPAFSGGNAITINAVGNANPYPSTFVASGMPTTGITVTSVQINGFAHTFANDVDILLQSPTGQNVVIMSDALGGNTVTNRDYTFTDGAAATLPASAVSGTYKPTNVNSGTDTWPAPGPGAFAQATPTLATFTGNMNGTWRLLVVDDTGGDAGSIASWSVNFSAPPPGPPTGYTWLWSPAAGLSSTTTNPVAASPMNTTTYQVMGTAPNGCQSVAQITINVNQLPAVTVPPSNLTVCENSTATFSATATGAGLTYQWQVATAAAPTTWSNATGAVYSGDQTPTLTIANASFSLNGNRYRLVVSGTCAPAATSNAATLTVNAAPVVTITAASSCGGVAGINGTQLTAASSTGGNFIWSPTTGLYTNATATTAYTGTPMATVYAAPTANTVYTATATNATTGCTGTSTIAINYTPPMPTVSPAATAICLTTPKTYQPLQITTALGGSITTTYSSGAVNIAIPDMTPTATTSTIVPALPTGSVVSSVVVTLNMSHTYPGDMIFNLKAPNGRIMNLYKFNNGTGTGPVSGVSTWGWYNAQISDASSTAFTSVGAAPFIYRTPPTVFKPDGRNTDVTAAGFPFNNPTGFDSEASSLASLLVGGAAGTWTLAMADGGPGDVGTLASWSLTMTYAAPYSGIWSVAGSSPASYTGLYMDATGATPYTGASVNTVYASPAVTTTYQVTIAGTASCPSQPRTVVVNVNTPLSITTQPVSTSTCVTGVATFTTVVAGSAANHNWQVSTANGTPGTFVNLVDGGVYSGVHTATLTITNPPLSMDTYTYRDLITTTPCGNDSSVHVNLSVKGLPNVSIDASRTTLLPTGLASTAILTANPNVSTGIYEWYYNGVLIPGATTYKHIVDIDHLGTYTVNLTDGSGCSNSSASVVISDSASGRVFIYPNPNSGVFQVRYHSTSNNSNLPRALNIYDDKGARVQMQSYSIGASYARMDVDMRKFGTGTYWVEVVDANGDRLAMGRVIIMR